MTTHDDDLTYDDSTWAAVTRDELRAAIKQAERDQKVWPFLFVGFFAAGVWWWDLPKAGPTYLGFLIVAILGGIMNEVFNVKIALLKAELREVLRVTGTLPSPGRPSKPLPY